MLLNRKNKTNEDEVKILRVLPGLCHSKIMFPVVDSNTHWFLIEIWVKERMIPIYDSLQHHHDEFIQTLVKVLENAGKMTFPGDWDKWETKYTTDDYIRQVDGHSCGVLTSFYAWRLANNRPLDFWNNKDKVATRAAAKRLRHELMTSIISGKANMTTMKSVRGKKQKKINAKRKKTTRTEDDLTVLQLPEINVLV